MLSKYKRISIITQPFTRQTTIPSEHRPQAQPCSALGSIRFQISHSSTFNGLNGKTASSTKPTA